MKIIKLEIYSLQTLPIQKGIAKNFLKGGRLSKRAKTENGSFTELLKDNDNFEWKFKDLEIHGYKNIHTGYIDNQLFLEKDEEQYIGFLSMKLENWSDFITLGFSSHK